MTAVRHFNNILRKFEIKANNVLLIVKIIKELPKLLEKLKIFLFFLLKYYIITQYLIEFINNKKSTIIQQYFF